MTYACMKATVKIVGNGKVTIPKTIREALDLEHGDTVSIDVEALDDE